MKTIGLSLVSALVLSACAAPSQIMMRSDGASVRCAAIGGGVIGVTAAIISKNGCVSDYREMGYVTLEEYNEAKASGNLSTVGKSPAAKPQAVQTSPVSSLGKVDISLSGSWVRKQPSETMLQGGVIVYALNPSIDAGIILTSPRKADIPDALVYANARKETQAKNLTNPVTSETSEIVIDGRKAYRANITGALKSGVLVRYQLTVIEGTKDIATTNVWSAASKFADNEAALSSLPQFVTGIDN